MQKAWECYGGDVSRLLDVARARLAFSDSDSLARCLELIAADAVKSGAVMAAMATNGGGGGGRWSGSSPLPSGMGSSPLPSGMGSGIRGIGTRSSAGCVRVVRVRDGARDGGEGTGGGDYDAFSSGFRVSGKGASGE